MVNPQNTNQSKETETIEITIDDDSSSSQQSYVNGCTNTSDSKTCTIEKSKNIEEMSTTTNNRPPSVNVPEKIIFCIDSCESENATSFTFPNGTKVKTLPMLIRAVKTFINNKNFISTCHQYAIIVYNDRTATWMHDFTYFPEEISDVLGSLQESVATAKTFPLNTIFEVISSHIMLPVLKLSEPPPYIIRLILLYNRSHTVPILNTSPEVNCLLGSPYFTFDIIMINDNIDDNKDDPEKNSLVVLNALKRIDPRMYSYMFVVERNPLELLNCMAKLVAHPLQRPPRSVAKSL